MPKPWEVPIQYNDDMPVRNPSTGMIERHTDREDIAERLSRPDPADRPARHYECNDTTPLDYSRGPHEREYDCAEEIDD